MPRSPERDRIINAVHGSGCAAAWLWGMKHRAATSPPTAATGAFPYPARTCAEWEELPGGQIREREPTTDERQAEAEAGSAMLRDAIMRLAA